MKHAQKGFTLIEIMIVVAIIAILAAVAIPNFISYRKTSQKNACLANLKAMDAATEALFVKNPAKESAEGDAAFSINDIYDSADPAKSLIKTEPKCPCAGTYAWKTDKRMWTCNYTDSDTDYSHTRE